MKIRALLSLTGIFLAYSFALFGLGCKLQNEKTAIALGKPFDMYLNLSQGFAREAENYADLELKKIYLLPEEYTPEEEQFILQIKRIDEHRIPVPIGNITAQKGKVVDLPKIPGFFAMSPAYAQEDFEWYGHEENYQFREEFIDRYTIRRYYDDGWILEYKVDEQGYFVPFSFRWIRRG